MGPPWGALPRGGIQGVPRKKGVRLYKPRSSHYAQRPMSPASLSRRTLLLGLAVASIAVAKPSSRFTFKTPQGWTDMLADGLPDEIVTNLHPSLAAQLLTQDHLAFAVDLNPGTHGQNSFMQAILLGGKIEVNDNTLPDLRKQIEQKNKDNEVESTIRSAEILQIGGADVARVVWEVKNDEGNEVRMAYLLPGGEDPGAMIIYGSNAKEFDRVRPLMEASAMATQGVVPQPKFKKYFYKALPLIQITGAAGLIALLLSSRKKTQLATTVPARTVKKDEPDEDGDDGDDENSEKPGEDEAAATGKT